MPFAYPGQSIVGRNGRRSVVGTGLSGAELGIAFAPSATVLYSLFKPAGYSGMAGRIQRMSDSAQMDVGYASNGKVDTAAIDAFRGASDASWVMLYDLTGSGKDLVIPASPANYDPTNVSLLGIPTLCFYARNGVALPNTIVGDSRAVTVLTIDAMSSSAQSSAKWQLGTGNGVRISAITEAAGNGLGVVNATPTTYGGAINRAQLEVSVVSSGAANRKVRINDSVKTLSAGATKTADFVGGHLGGNSEFAWYEWGDMVTFGVWPSQLDDATVVEPMVNSALSKLGIITSRANNIVMEGDSRVSGLGSQGFRAPSRQIAPLLTKPAHIHNQAYSGKSLSQVYANRAAIYGNRFLPGANNFALVEACINDINGAGATGADLFANTFVPLVQYLKTTVGYQFVLAQTPEPYEFSTNAAAKETERLAFISKLRDPANIVTYGYTLVDTCANAAFDAVPSYSSDTANTAIYSTDRIHFNSSGSGLIAQILASVINPLLV